MAFKMAKTGPREAQDRPKRAQEPPREPQKGPKNEKTPFWKPVLA